MRYAGLMLFALALLAAEGAFMALLHVEFLRPDPILVLVVFIALKSDTILGPAMVLLLGLLADSSAGINTGVLAGAYLMVWTFVRVAKIFLLQQRRSVQLILVFVSSLLILIYVQLLWPSLGQRHGGFIRIGAWGLLLALANSMLAVPIWSIAGKILGESERKQRTIFSRPGE